jgi:hypothetical protein
MNKRDGTNYLHLLDLTLFDAQVDYLLQELRGTRAYRRDENKLTVQIRREQADSNGLVIIHDPLKCSQQIYYFEEGEEFNGIAIVQWRTMLMDAITNTSKAKLNESLSTLVLINKRKIGGVHDFDVCRFYPSFCDLGGRGNTSTVGVLTYKGNVVSSDKNFLIGKRLNPLCISLLSLYWRSYISNDWNEIFATYFNYLKSRNPETPLSQVSTGDIYHMKEDSWWNSSFSYSPETKLVDRSRLEFDEMYFKLAFDFYVPNDTNELLNKYFMLSAERQIVFQRASECYRIALKHYYSNKYMAATYMAISIEALAKFEYKVNNPKQYNKAPKSSEYYKDFFREYIGKSDALEEFIGLIYKLRCEHVHDGFIPNELWESTELNEMTINSIEMLVHYCLISWLTKQEITVEHIF